MSRRRRPARPLPHHRVPPGLLMVVRSDEVMALAAWNDERDDDLTMAVEQWRFNVATREAILDCGGRVIDGGWMRDVNDRDGHNEWTATLDWHFPQDRRQCPDRGRCHHGCGPLAGCWRVATCVPLSGYGESWTLVDRIAHERPGGSL